MGFTLTVAILIALGALLGAWLRPTTAPRPLAQSRAERLPPPLPSMPAELGAGHDPADPIVVPSASVIEPAGERIPCPACDGRVRVTDHRAMQVDGQRLRAVDLKCTACGLVVTRHFQLASARELN